MPQIITTEEFNQHLTELQKITKFQAKKRSTFLPRRFSMNYIFWMLYLLVFAGVIVTIQPDTLGMTTLLLFIALVSVHLAELYRSRAEDLVILSKLQHYIERNIMRENEALIATNNFLLRELAKRDA